MKKISIITILDNTNFGTYLQALALGIVLQKKGCDVEFVNYWRRTATLSYVMLLALKKSPIKMLYNIFYNIPLTFMLKAKNHLFLSRFIALSDKKYTSFEELQSNPPVADIYMTGSDQVWNSLHNGGIEKAFFLDFVPNGSKKVSYASSIGMDCFPDGEEGLISSLLSTYDFISVREKQAQNLLLDMGIKHVELVLDPTLLLTKSDWHSIMLESGCFTKTEKYLLIYTVETCKENEIIYEIALKIAQERKLSIYNVSYNDAYHKLKFCDRNFSRASPDLFLHLIYNADFIVASSFHGTAFALNMNKNFFSVVPYRFNTRVKSLLSLLNLQERLVSGSGHNVLNVDDINFDVINRKLALEREKSLSYLDRIIS